MIKPIVIEILSTCIFVNDMHEKLLNQYVQKKHYHMYKSMHNNYVSDNTKRNIRNMVEFS